MSSGTESAAYQAGALKGLVENLPAELVRYQAVSGVAASASNAVIYSSFEPGREIEAAERLV